MRICHLTTVHPRNDVRILHKQCVFAAKAGIDVVLLVADGQGNNVFEQVNIQDIGNYRLSRLKRLTTAKRTIFNLALKNDADIYQLHDPELISVGLKLKKLGKKVVFDSHEDVPKQILYKTWLGPMSIRKLIAKRYNAYEKKAAAKFDGLISVIDEITNKFNCTHQITLKNYPITNVYAEHVLPFTEKKKQFVYVGSLTFQRGIKDCIEAMRFFPEEYRLILIGSFPSQQFYEDCQGLKDWERVDYLGFLSMEKVAPIIGESLAGLSVLHAEANYLTSLPTKGFEYMAAGTPVVLSDFEYWHPYFKDCGVFIEPGDSQAIANGLKLVIAKELYENLQKQCITTAKKFSWEAEADKMVAFYQKILKLSSES